MDSSNRDDGLSVDLAAVSTLVDPVRRSLYDHVVAQCSPVTRDEAATAVGVSRTLAAYHLDKLAEAGLLGVGYARPEGRGGPGAGRPAKYYKRSDHQVSVNLPARSYGLMADVLATALDADETGAVRAAAKRAADDIGRAAGEGSDLEAALRDAGYEPTQTTGGDIELRNCPFHQLAASHTELVCGLNMDLITGVLEGIGQPGSRAELKPREGRCCVVIHPGDEPG